VQHATAAVSIAGSILLCLLFIGLVYDLIAGYSARRRFAKLLSLKRVWHGGKSCATAAPPISGRAYRAYVPRCFSCRAAGAGVLSATTTSGNDAAHHAYKRKRAYRRR
jgi:hypothetical protein